MPFSFSFRNIDEAYSLQFYNGMMVKQGAMPDFGKVFPSGSVANGRAYPGDINAFVWEGKPSLVIDGDIFHLLEQMVPCCIEEIYDLDPEEAYFDSFGERHIVFFRKATADGSFVGTHRWALTDEHLDFRATLCAIGNHAIDKLTEKLRKKKKLEVNFV